MMRWRAQTPALSSTVQHRNTAQWHSAATQCSNAVQQHSATTHFYATCHDGARKFLLHCAAACYCIRHLLLLQLRREQRHLRNEICVLVGPLLIVCLASLQLLLQLYIHLCVCVRVWDREKTRWRECNQAANRLLITYTHSHIHTHTYVYSYIHTHIFVYINIYMCVYIYTCVNIYLYIYIPIRTRIYI